MGWQNELQDHVIQSLKRDYPKGTRIECVWMDDFQAVPEGTLGTVTCVDDIGTIHVSWDNGSGLGLVPGTDRFRKVQ